MLRSLVGSEMCIRDSHWTTSDKQRCRKCKHIILSLDDVNQQLPQRDFKDQFTTFVGHLQRLMNDTTFPIWVLTQSTPPSELTSTLCHEPYLYHRTTDHPCNDVIRGVLLSNMFQKRVHLMDNSDIVLPAYDVTTEKVLANIAMRVFVAVGKGVADWRARGQRGRVDGLHRNCLLYTSPSPRDS